MKGQKSSWRKLRFADTKLVVQECVKIKEESMVVK